MLYAHVGRTFDSFTTLNISGFPVLDGLADIIVQNCPSLQKLYIGACASACCIGDSAADYHSDPIGYSAMSERGYTNVVKALDKSLQELHVHWSGSISANWIMSLAEVGLHTAS
jgi:hypothetical protein